MSKRRPTVVSRFDINDPDLLSKFKKAAKRLSAVTLKSKASARAALIEDGIITKSGRLTKNYGG